jgi:two-component system phosphate regulon response regulator PhoB
MKQTILVVDDEADVSQMLKSNLKRAGYSVVAVEDGQQAIDAARSDKPDLMILDLMLPSMSGLEVCRVLKGDAATSRMPIIMLTARHEEIDRVVGFELGADDYVTKPFSPRELVLRVQSVLRRSTGWQEAPAARVQKTEGATNGAEPVTLKAGRITLDYERCEVRVGQKSIPFSPLEFKLLSVLAERPGAVCSREKLLNEVWGYQKDTETRTVDMHVLRLREKLGNASDCLETVRGFGYRITETSRH